MHNTPHLFALVSSESQTVSEFNVFELKHTDTRAIKSPTQTPALKRVQFWFFSYDQEHTLCARIRESHYINISAFPCHSAPNNTGPLRAQRRTPDVITARSTRNTSHRTPAPLPRIVTHPPSQ